MVRTYSVRDTATGFRGLGVWGFRGFRDLGV